LVLLQEELLLMLREMLQEMLLLVLDMFLLRLLLLLRLRLLLPVFEQQRRLPQLGVRQFGRHRLGRTQ